jgi:hypothetical protein
MTAGGIALAPQLRGADSAGSRAPLDSELLKRPWPARWIAPPGVSPREYGVYHFRKSFEVEAQPREFWVHVTADNRYELFVNGRCVSWGPARGDLEYWNFETVNLGPFLKAGRNVVAAIVWNYADQAPMAQITHETGFLLCGNTAAEKAVNTDKTWRCLRNEACSAVKFDRDQVRGYFVVGPGERVDAAQYPWGWEQEGFDDSKWASVVVGTPGVPREARDSPSRWMLVPRAIPATGETKVAFAKVRRAEGIATPGLNAAFTIPARTRAVLLFDQSYLMTGFPELLLSGGKGAKLRLGYAESLFEKGVRFKGNRDEVDGKEFRGFYDEFVADGGARRLWRPLWWRTYRYAELTVETAEEPVTVERIESTSVGFPFEAKARLNAGSPKLDRMLEVGWRTQRLCAQETFTDCPYYEQLQYIGDARIQAMVTYYMASDPRLARSGIAQMDQSRRADGITMSRYPSRLPQYIPGFSLWWIGMVHDYWRYVPDTEFVRERLRGSRSILDAFAAWQKPNGSLKAVPWWRFMDWTKEWRGGDPPQLADGGSAPFDLAHLLALDYAAELETALGSKAVAQEYRDRALRLRGTIDTLYWDARRGLYADTPDRREFSQHSNALAVLAGLKREAEAQALLEKVISDRSLTQCSFYFLYYVHEALRVAGMGDRYLDQLGPWEQMLAQGFTTWAEEPDSKERPTRSDCHAWSSSPNIFLFRTVLGVDSAAPGFSRVAIRPHLGSLAQVSGRVPHPKGFVSVSLTAAGRAELELPVDGVFEWRGKRIPVGAGKHSLRL